MDNAIEVWYQANLACVRACEGWSKEIKTLEAKRTHVPAGYTESLSKWPRSQLTERLMLMGKDAKRLARTGTKQAMIDFLIQSRIDEIDQQIAQLRRQIADNQPDPRWRSSLRSRQQETKHGEKRQ